MELVFFPTSEGFFDYENKRYIYQYKDHLGNVRLSYTKNPATGLAKVLNGNHYYPFGMNHLNQEGTVYDPLSVPYNYKYNGKELQETGFYDYGWRQYMPDIARWNGMDQLSEDYISHSPYAYVINNPISYYDPDGRKIEETSSGWTFTGNDIKLIFSYFSSGGDFGNMSDQLGSFGGNFGNGAISSFWNSFNGGNTFGRGKSAGSNLSWWTNSNASYGGSNIQGLDGHRTKIDQGGFNSFVDRFVSSDITGRFNITGSVISEGARNLEKAVEARKGIFLTSRKTIIQNGYLRELNGSTYKNIKGLGKGLGIVGYGITIATIGNDLAKGNYYTAGTRTVLNGAIIGVCVVCPACGFGLSILEATAGDSLYKNIENNFDK